jgi:hypothetical protein
MQQEEGKHKIKLDSKIGIGAFGIVYKGTKSLHLLFPRPGTVEKDMLQRTMPTLCYS